MKLSQNNKVNIITAIGVVVLTALLNFSITNARKPDLRYEEGPFYNTTDNSTTVLKIKNYGAVDADNVVINIIFPTMIKDIHIDDSSINLQTQMGGIDNMNVVFKIDRIVPKEQLYIYFSVEPLSNILDLNNQKGYIRSIKYRGGIGKEGLPFWHSVFTSNIPAMLYTVLGLILSLYLLFNWIRVNKRWKQISKEFPEYNERSIQLKKDMNMLIEATKLIDKSITKLSEASVEVPKDVIMLLQKVKKELYGCSDSE